VRVEGLKDSLVRFDTSALMNAYDIRQLCRV